MQFKNKMVLTTLAALLTACGGGGSSGSNISGETNPPAIPSDVKQSEHLQLTVPTPNYDVNAENLASFNAINKFRASLGLGLWAQNTKLDLAAQNHVEYEVLHKVFGHYETKGLAGFTGYDPNERAVYVGYAPNWVGEVAVTGTGQEGIEALINSVYHRSGLMNQEKSEVGIANSSDQLFPVQCVNFSNAKGSQNNSPDFIAVYPLNNQINVPTFMILETPDPFPSLKFPGSPISFASVAGSKLKVISFTVTQQGFPMPLITQLITQDNDPNPGHLPAHEAYISGVERFLPNTTYIVHFEGFIDAKPTKRDWSFTTGDQ